MIIQYNTSTLGHVTLQLKVSALIEAFIKTPRDFCHTYYGDIKALRSVKKERPTCVSLLSK